MGLTSQLPAACSYEGFDNMRNAVDWCSKSISAKFPNFRFRFEDVRNSAYNPSGRHTADQFRFPYDDDCFDVVFAVSVFTHMVPEEVSNYISEVSRVLRPGGICFITYFLLDEIAIDQLKSTRTLFDFKFDFGFYRLLDVAVPGAAVAYSDDYVRSEYKRFGLEIREIIYGSWCERGQQRDSAAHQSSVIRQDVVIAGFSN